MVSSLFILVLVLIASNVFLAHLLLKSKRTHIDYMESVVATRNRDVLSDLDLATSDQLLSELRRRPLLPYIFLTGKEENGARNLTIEVHNMPPASSLQLLAAATQLTVNEMQKRGIEIPNTPPEWGVFGDDEENWNESFGSN